LELKIARRTRGKAEQKRCKKLQEAAKAMKTQMVEPFMGKGIKAKRVK
jgi:hypothetical protein